MTRELFFVLIYMALQLGIGIWISQRIKTESDYLIAGRQLGYLLATFSIFATWFGAETVVGAAGKAYESGVSLGSAEPFGYGLCLILMGVVFAVPLYRRRLTTLADLFRIRYSANVERVAAIILIPSSILWAAAQVRAFGSVISTVSTWDVDLAIGIAALFTILYTMFGGLLVDAVTDVLQGALLLVGLVLLFIFVLGRIESIPSALSQSAGISVLPHDGTSALEIAESWAIPVFGSVLATELVGRVIATRNETVARRTPIMAAALYLCAGLIPVSVGLLAPALGVHIANGEQVVPLVAKELLPAIVYAVFVGAFISAILSTVDSTLLTASGLLSHNLIVPIARVTNERTKVMVARAGVLVFGMIAYGLAVTAEGVFALVEQASALGSSGALVVICFGLFTSFGGPAAAITTLITGTASYSVLAIARFEYPFLTSVALSVFLYIVISRLGVTHNNRRRIPSKPSRHLGPNATAPNQE